MTSGGAEAFKAAIRRSLVLIVLLVLLGIVAVNALRQLHGPRYAASAHVLVSTQPLAQIITGTITGTTPPFIDPNRIMADARALAGSGRVYDRAVRETGYPPGEMAAATSVSGGTDNDILNFTASSDDANRAVGIANGVAAAYVGYRAALNSRDIRNQADHLRAELTTMKPDDPARSGLQAQLNKLGQLASAASSDAKLVQKASSATKTSPAPAKDSILGLSIGLVIALLVVAVREAVDTTVRSETDVEDLLSTQVLATFPSLPRRTRLVTYGRHEVAFADTYALLAANIAQAHDKNKHAVTAVTSAVSREGKTTTAANLAVSLARRGMNVILCDFDFRKPALAELFSVPTGAPGVLQVLDGSAPLNDSLWSVTLSGARPRISRNGLGPLPEAGGSSNGSDTAHTGALRLLSSGGSVKSSVVHGPRLGRLLQELRSRADVVILDTPPALLTVEMAELSRQIDEVLVVVRQGRVTQRSLRTLSRQTRSWSAELAGAVLTDAPSDEQSAYYGIR